MTAALPEAQDVGHVPNPLLRWQDGKIDPQSLNVSNIENGLYQS